LPEQKPLVSIGLPVYNGEESLRPALDCLLAQDYNNFELIISDNASTDGTVQICQAYVQRDTRIRLHCNQQNVGIVANFARVLDLANGNYFMWAAHDDLWAPAFLSVLVEELENNPEASVAMSAVERFRKSDMTSSVVRFDAEANPVTMSQLELTLALAKGSPHHLFFYGLFRTGFLRQAFKNFPRVIAGDRLMMIQVAMSTRFRYVDQVLHTRLINDASLAVRYKNEEFGKAWHDRNAHLKKDLAIGPYLFQSQIIPWQRKFWIPTIVIWPTLNRLYYRLNRFFYGLAGRLFGQGGQRKRIVRYLKRLANVNSR
jgi:glycosyltransferase involved in cell wall biosynthesis